VGETTEHLPRSSLHADRPFLKEGEVRQSFLLGEDAATGGRRGELRRAGLQKRVQSAECKVQSGECKACLALGKLGVDSGRAQSAE